MVRKLPKDGRVVGLPSLHGLFVAETNGGYHPNHLKQVLG